MEELERSIRRIVSKSDVNVVTKRMVRVEYMKQHKLVSLRPHLKAAINQVLNGIVQELTVHLKQGHSLDSLQLSTTIDRFMKSEKAVADHTSKNKQKLKKGVQRSLNYERKSFGKCIPQKNPCQLFSADEVRDIFLISDDSENSVDLCYPSRSTAETESVSSSNWEEDIALLSSSDTPQKSLRETDTTNKSFRETDESPNVSEQRCHSNSFYGLEKSHINNTEVIMIDSSPEVNSDKNKGNHRGNSQNRNWLSIFSDAHLKTLAVDDFSDNDHSAVESPKIFPQNLFRSEDCTEIVETNFDSEKVKKINCGEKYELNRLLQNNFNKAEVTNKKCKIISQGANEHIYSSNKIKLKSRHHGKNLWVKVKNVPLKTCQVEEIRALTH